MKTKNSPIVFKSFSFRKTLIPGAIFGFLAFSFAAHAAPANTLNYQGKLTDTSGVPVADTNYDFKLTLWDSVSGGTCLWSALGSCGTPTAKTLATKTGIFSTELGASGDNSLNLDFNSDVYLQIQVNTDSPMSPRRKVNASAYSLNTKKLDGQDSSYYLNASTEAQTKQGNLTVNGDVTVGNSSSDHLVVYGGNSANGDITTTSGSLTLKPNAGDDLNVSLSGSGELKINTSQFYVDGNTGNVGVGTTDPLSRLSVFKSSSVSTDLAGFGLTANPSSDSNYSLRSVVGTVNYTGSGNITGAGGIDAAYFQSTNSSSVTVSRAFGSIGETLLAGNGTITSAVGVYGVVQNLGSGNIVSASGGSFAVDVTSGSITNAYGVFIGDVEGSNRWSLYAANASAPSYFAGSVGIGTTNPSVKTHINGQLFVGESSVTAGSLTGLPFTANDGSRAIWIGDHAGGNNTDYGLIYGEHDNSGANDLYRLNIIAGDNANGTANYDDSVFIGSVDYITSAKKGMTILNGNVGIGTTSPTYSLDVATNTNYPLVVRTFNNTEGAAVRLNSARGTMTSPLAVTSGYEIGSVRTIGYDGSAFSTDRASIRWFAAENWTSSAQGTFTIFNTTATGSTTLSERMRILSSGNVGIGTTNPGQKLDVNGSIQTPIFTLGGSNTPIADRAYTRGVTSGFVLSPAYNLTAGADANIMYLAYPGDLVAGDTVTTRIQETIFVSSTGTSGNGNVGIGTSPSNKLHVAGDIRVGTGTTGCVYDADGTTIAGTCSSDQRLKKNVVSLTGMMDRIAKLNPVSYNWRNDEFPDKGFGTETQYGLIAQEVEAIFPELVKTGSDGYKQVAYHNIPIYLLAGLKEQQGRISANDELLNLLRTETKDTFATLFSASSEKPQTDPVFLTLGDTIEKTDDTLTKKLEDQKDKITLLLQTTETANQTIELLQAGFDNQQIQLTALMDFYTNLKLGNFLTLDEKSNLILPGNLTVNDIEAKTVEAEGLETKTLTAASAELDNVSTKSFAVKNEEGSETIGSAEIPAGETKVTVKTKAVGEGSKVFVTLSGNNAFIPIVVASQEDEVGFVVEIQERQDQDVKFNWWIVGGSGNDE